MYYDIGKTQTDHLSQPSGRSAVSLAPGRRQRRAQLITKLHGTLSEFFSDRPSLVQVLFILHFILF